MYTTATYCERQGSLQQQGRRRAAQARGRRQASSRAARSMHDAHWALPAACLVLPMAAWHGACARHACELGPAAATLRPSDLCAHVRVHVCLGKQGAWSARGALIVGGAAVPPIRPARGRVDVLRRFVCFECGPSQAACVHQSRAGSPAIRDQSPDAMSEGVSRNSTLVATCLGEPLAYDLGAVDAANRALLL